MKIRAVGCLVLALGALTDAGGLQNVLKSGIPSLAADPSVGSYEFGGTVMPTDLGEEDPAGPVGGAKRIEFTCSGYQGNSALVGFPVLVRLGADSPRGFSYDDLLDSSSGAELRFEDEDENPLPYEIESWNPSGASYVWVRVPELTKKTTFTMTYGRAPEGTVTSSAVWAPDYVGVWHMAEANGPVADATGHGLAAVPTGTTTAQVATDGPLGNARVNGNSTSKGWLAVAYDTQLNLGETFTMSGWYKMTALNGSSPIFGRQFGWSVRTGWMFEMSGSYTDFAARGKGGVDRVEVTGSNPSAENAWVHVAVVYKGTTATVYGNGVQIASGPIETVVDEKDTALTFGYGNTRNQFYGAFDEFRLRPGVVSADWIKAEHDQANAAFLSAEVTVVPTPGVEVTLAIPALENMSVRSVTVSKAQVAPEADGTYRVTKGAPVTVEFAAADGYILDARTMKFRPTADLTLPESGRPKAVAIADVALRLNEIGASNDDESGVETARGGKGLDWIELRNDCDFDVDVAGWYLTDSPDKARSKWRKIEGDGVIPAHGYRIVWADKDYADWSASEAHVAISLSTSGEPLLLAASDGTTVDSIANFGKQLKGVSYGLVGETDAYGFFRVPTPGAANGTDAKGRPTPIVTLSEPHGYKTAAFSLSMTCEDPSATIYYTTDGSSPTLESTKYTGPVTVSKTTVVRAAAVIEDSILQEDAAATYLFLSDILTQSAENRPAGFPDTGVNGQSLVYGLSTAITRGDADTVRRLGNGFTNTIRTLSLVIDPKHMFDAETGIYVNPSKDGREWERQTMMEQINPKDGADGFTVPCGIKIRGAFSRGLDYPKHSFHVVFRSDYGKSKLDFPLFGDEGASSFDRIDLRTSQNCSWANTTTKDSLRNIFTLVEDVFSRDTQRDMGQPYNRSRYYNLFINGVYWGLYQTEERINQYCAETNNGGKEGHYDVVRTSTSYASSTSAPIYTTGTVEGEDAAWPGFYDIVHEGFGSSHPDNYNRVRGLNPDGTRNPDYPVYLNPENLIDYMLIAHWTANCDTPAASDGKVNNQAAYRNRVDGEGDRDGFIWHLHDCEFSLGTYSGPASQANTYGTIGYGLNAEGATYFGPTMINRKLMANSEYRQLFADLAYRHLFRPDGVLAKKNAIDRFASRMAEIDDAVVCEAARWGNGKTREDWLAACNMITNTFMNRRDEVMKLGYRDAAYAKKAGWYPSVNPPTVLNAAGTRLLGGESVEGAVTLTGTDKGTVYYTTDGSDPRLVGGAASSAAQVYSSALAVPGAGLALNARVLTADGEWSALEQVELTGSGGGSLADSLRFHSFDGVTPTADGDSEEWIVLTNLNQEVAFDLAGVRIVIIKDGDTAAKCDFRIPAGTTVAPGGSVRLDQAACGWDKIANNKIRMHLYDTDGTTPVQTSEIVTQKSFASYYGAGGPGGEAYLVATSFAAQTTGGDWIASDFIVPPTPASDFYTGDYDEPVTIVEPGEYFFSNANFNAGLVLGSGTYVLKNNKGTTNTASSVTSTGTIVFKQAGTFELKGTEGTLMSVFNLFVSNGTFRVDYASETAKSIAVNVTGSFAVESEGEVDVTIGGVQNYGIYLANKDHFCRVGSNGVFRATVGGVKCAALYGNKGSVDAEVKNDSKVKAVLTGSEARLFNFAGNIKLDGGKIAVTADESSLSNKVFKSEKSITVKKGAKIDILVPGAGSEAFSCANAFEMQGGTVEVVSADDCVGAETNVVITGGRFYGFSTGNDVFDTNAGDITVSGGLVLAYTTAQEPTDKAGKTVGSFGFDVNGNAVNLNGGTVVALGGENLKDNHYPTVAGSQPYFADVETDSSAYSGKFISLAANGTTTTVRLPTIDSTRCTVLMTFPGMSAGQTPTVSGVAPEKGSIDFHDVYLISAEPFALGEPAARPQTDYNGSAVTVAFTGEIPAGAAFSAKVTLGGSDYEGAVDAETGLVSFAIPASAVTAGKTYAGTVTVTVGGTSYVKEVTFAQGTFVFEERTDWIAESAETFESTGEWSGDKVVVEGGKIAVSNAMFAAKTAAPEGSVVMICSTFDFNDAAEDAFDASARAGIRVVSVGGDRRYAVLTADGAVTNLEVVADVSKPASVTVTLDDAEGTVAYSVNGVSLGSYAMTAAEGGVGSVTYTGETDVESLAGAYRFEGLDANLAKAGGVEYATVAEALAAGAEGVELLWDASWNPSAAGEYAVATNGHLLVIGGSMAWSVKDNGDGTLTVTVTGGSPVPAEPASISVAGTTVTVTVKDSKADLWYALEKATDVAGPYTVDASTWTKGATALSIALDAGEAQAFYRVVTSASEPK